MRGTVVSRSAIFGCNYLRKFRADASSRANASKTLSSTTDCTIMSDFHSNIKVFPSFSDTAFFSGEDFSCTLTFKNVAEPSPASSNTSLSQSRGTKIGADNNLSKFTGVETMADAGRSASEGGGVVSPERTTSPHSRSYSTVGHSGAERSNFNYLLRNHGRSQSVAELPALSETTSPRISPSKRERKIERTISILA